MQKYYEAENQRVDLLREAEEERRKKFVENYKSSKKDKMTQEDIDDYRESLMLSYELDRAEKNYPNDPFINLPFLDHLFNPKYTKENEDRVDALNKINDHIKEIENRYTPEAMYNA